MIRHDAQQEMREERINKALCFDISRDGRPDDDMGDDMDMARTTSSEVQATTQMASSGAQARPETKSSETMATEDRSAEIARLEAIHAQEKQALIATDQANIETITKQVREQMVGEAERRHEQKKEECIQ